MTRKEDMKSRREMAWSLSAGMETVGGDINSDWKSICTVGALAVDLMMPIN